MDIKEMQLEDMTLEQVTERLSDLDMEVREMTKVEDVEAAKETRQALLDRKAELEDLKERKQEILDLQAGKTAPVRILETRKEIKPIEMMSRDEIVASPEYRSAFLKRLMGKELNEVEQRSVATADVAGAIPTMTSDLIFNKIREIAPLLGEVTLLNVAGNVTFAVEGTNNAAALHSENGELTPKEDTLASVSLAGFEIVKLVRISATVRTMTINAFEGWLADLLAENIATMIENYMINGTGDAQPKGVEKAQVWVDGTNAVDWGQASPTYAELTETVSYLKGGYYRRAKWLMNHKTFWARVQAIRDDGKAPIVQESGGKYYMLGKEVLFSDYVGDDVIYVGDFKKMVANLAQQINVATSEHSGFAYNAIDFRGSAIFDCDIAVGEAFVKSAASL